MKAMKKQMGHPTEVLQRIKIRAYVTFNISFTDTVARTFCPFFRKIGVIKSPIIVEIPTVTGPKVWCARPDLNWYGLPHAPQTCASAYSATGAYKARSKTCLDYLN